MKEFTIFKGYFMAKWWLLLRRLFRFSLPKFHAISTPRPMISTSAFLPYVIILGARESPERSWRSILHHISHICSTSFLNPSSSFQLFNVLHVLSIAKSFHFVYGFNKYNGIFFQFIPHVFLASIRSLRGCCFKLKGKWLWSLQASFFLNHLFQFETLNIISLN